MSKKTISLVCFCIGAASPFTEAQHLTPRQADSAVDSAKFLRRAYHSSAVLHGRLYIDGGDFSYTDGNNSTVYQSSNTLISLDLSQDWTNSSVVLHSAPKPSGVPSLSNGGIWVNRRRNLLYTGFAGIGSIFGDGAVYPQGLWSFEPDGSSGDGSWESLNGTADDSFVSQPRPFDGSVASGTGVGYFLGGVAGNSSTFQNSPRGMFAYDFSSNQASYGRDSGSSSSPTAGTQDGAMVFVPFFGNLGIIISAGGQQRIAGGGSSSSSSSSSGPEGGSGIPGGGGGSTASGLASFSTVQVYNPQDQKWYDQKTSGTVPPGRMQFCMAGTPSDNRTYEILVYAGWDGSNLGSATGAVQFDEAYVLTIPAFFWVKANYTAAHPRLGLTCNAVGGGQILTVGGVDPTQGGTSAQSNNNNGNNNNNGSSYSAVFDTRDPFTQGLGIFDLGSLSWKSSYSSKRGLYTAAPAVQEYYNKNGRTPSGGFASSSLQTIFAQSNFNNPADLPFPGSGGSGSGSSYGRRKNNNSNAGAIAGGVMGGIAGVGAVAGFFFWRKRRHNQKKKKNLFAAPDDIHSSDDNDEHQQLQDQSRRRYTDQTGGQHNMVGQGGGDDNDGDAAARMEHANSASRYPYSPGGFYHTTQPALPEIATTAAAAMAVPPALGTSVVGGGGGGGGVDGYRSAEKQGPPPAYEESESAAAATAAAAAAGSGLGSAMGAGDQQLNLEALHELPLSEAGGSESYRQSATVASGGINPVVDGMRPPVAELHEETSGRAELP